MSAILTSLREKRGHKREQYRALRAKYEVDGKLKPVREWETSDKTNLEDIHGELRDLEMLIELEEDNSRGEEKDKVEREAIVRRNTTHYGGGSGNADAERQIQLFDRALRGIGTGRDDWRHELRGQSSDILSEGGYLNAPQAVVAGILRKVDDALVIPNLATVFNDVPATGLGVVQELTEMDEPEWGDETSIGIETDVDFVPRSMIPTERNLLVKVTEKLLANANIDIVGYIQDRIAYKYGISAEKAFMNGSGINRPLGYFTPSNQGISTNRDIETGTAGQIKGDDLIDAVHNLKESHARVSVWILHRLVLREIRKLKGTDGHYIWQPDGQIGRGVVEGNPSTIAGRPYVLSEYAPSTVTAGSYVAVLGNHSYYYIARGPGLQIKSLVERYADEFKVGYRAHAMMDAQPVLEEAFTRVKVKA